MKRTPFILALVLLGSLAKAGDWTGFRSAPDGSGATSELLPPGLTLVWSAQLPLTEPRSSPTVVGNRVYVGGEDGALRCLDLGSGATLWALQTGGPVRTTPTYFKGRLYFGSLDGNLYVVHAGTGAVLWSLFHGGAQLSSPLVATVPGPVDVVFVGVGSRSDEIRAYEAITGAFLWAQPTGQPVTCKPAFHGGGTPKVIVGNDVGRWMAYDAVTGAPLWPSAFQASMGTPFTSAAVEGDRVILCSGLSDRSLHVLDANTGAQIKEVLVVPPGFGKVGGSVGGEVEPFEPETILDPHTVHELLNALDKTARDDEIDALAAARGFSASEMKEWFDRMLGEAPSSMNAPGGPYWINLSRPARTSSPAVSGGVAVIAHREMSGTGKDEFYTVAIDVTAAVPASSSVLWGTDPLTEAWIDPGIVPSPAISAGTYVYYARTKTLHIADLATGTSLGSVDVGDLITTGPTLANGRVIVGTVDGRLICYASGNTPPSAPTAFNPSGGANVTTTDMPTLFWSGQADPESAPGSLSSRLEFAYGWANGDLETTLEKTAITLPAGASSYQIVPPVPPNTHVFWRVRVEDPNGAQSGWSPVQDFWVNQDLDPPLPPGNVTAMPGDSQVTVSWSASPSSDVEMYRLRYKLSSDSWATATLVDDIQTTSQLVAGLTNGFAYDFSLVAVDFGENESAAAIVSATPTAAITIGGGGPGFATIQDALNAALPGQTVVLQPGTYVESVIVPPGVSVMGQSASTTILNGGGAPVIVQVNGTYGADPLTEIAYLTITNGGIGIDAGNADVFVHHVVMHTLSSDAIIGSSGGRLRVEFATIGGNGGDGISGTSPITSVSGCIIEQNGGFGADLPPAASVSYTDFYLNALGPLGGPVVETGNMSLMPVFTDAAYHVADGSVTVDKGDPAIPVTLEPSPNGGRANMGAYGNTAEAALTVGSGFTGGESGGTVGTTPGASPGGGGGGGGGCGLASAGAAPSGLGLLLVLGLFGMALARRGC